MLEIEDISPKVYSEFNCYRFSNYKNLDPNEYDTKKLNKLIISELKNKDTDIKISNVIDFESLLKELSMLEGNDAFYTIDINKKSQRAHLWKQSMPYVVPFYAVKTNNGPVIIYSLSAIGFGFDCASIKEIKQVLDYGVAHID